MGPTQVMWHQSSHCRGPQTCGLGRLCGGREASCVYFSHLKEVFTILKTFSLKPPRWATPPIVGEPSIQVGARPGTLPTPRSLCGFCQVHASLGAPVDSTLPVPPSMVSSGAQGETAPHSLLPHPSLDLVHSITATKGSGQKRGAGLTLAPGPIQSQPIGSTSNTPGVHTCLCGQAGRSHL